MVLPSEGRAIDPQYHDEFVVDGVARSLKSWWRAYRDCERNSDVEKGEYETREEFEARRAELARNCDTMWPLTNAVATKPVSLSDDSDGETFSFRVDLGDTGRPAGVWDLGFVSTRDEPEFWRRMCDADVACKRGTTTTTASFAGSWIPTGCRISGPRSQRAWSSLMRNPASPFRK